MMALQRFVLTVLFLCWGKSVGATTIKGHIDGVPGTYRASGTFISGWACQSERTQSINVHVYLGGAAGRGGKILKGFRANTRSETAVAAACQSTGKAYRFRIPISEAEAREHGGKSIYIHGISIAGTGNLLINRSGQFKVPTLPATPPPTRPPSKPPTRPPSKPPTPRPTRAPTITTVVKGTIDGPSGTIGSSYSINGWACQTGFTQSIRIHVYLGGRAGQGQFFRNILANRGSELAVANACQSTGTAYRFRIPISEAEASQHGGKAVFVHGISVAGTGNLLINRSGQFTIPTVASPTKPPTNPPTPRPTPSPTGAGVVKGTIDGPSGTIGSSYSINGWACQTGFAQSIRIHVYLGGPAGQGQMFKNILANQGSEPAVASACESTGNKYRFTIPVSEAEAQLHGGKAVYVHGISIAGTSNLLITRSGQFTIPTVPIPLSSIVDVNGNQDVTIAQGTSVFLDSDADLGLVRVEGQLSCPDDGSFTIRAQGILVTGQGAFTCGTAANPFEGDLAIELYGNRAFPSSADGTKAFVADAGGVITIHGKPGKAGFQYLQATASAGSNQITVSDASGWEVGDKIVIGSTDFEWNRSEQRTITAISGNQQQITLGAALQFRHWGTLQQYDNGKGDSWTLDERAEVINLNRNVVIRSANDSFAQQSAPVGGHMIVRGGGSAAYIGNVELFRMGQAGQMGRYPFHWHKRGNVDGQYIKDSSIHKSFSRCVTIHQSNFATVENNSCYNFLGHGFFLEDGNEIKNRLIGNIGMLAKRPAVANAMLQSDVAGGKGGRFQPTSTFWISHPDNYIVGNVASGSQGSGFWMAFVTQTFPNTNPRVNPVSSDTLAFDNNIAHSCPVGITHDGAPGGGLTNNPLNNLDRKIVNAHYRPQNVPTFNNLLAYKCSQAGFYFRGERVIYKNSIGADNRWTAFFAYDQEMVDFLFVGISENEPTAGSQSTGDHVGLLVYDGPFYADNAHFAGFNHPSRTTTAVKLVVGGAELFVNNVKGLTFDETPQRKLVMDPDGTNWADSYSAAILDVDGTLAGTPGALLRPNHPMNQDSRCQSGDVNSGELSTLVCNYDVSIIRLADLTASNTIALDYAISRRTVSNGEHTAPYKRVSKHLSKFSMITGNTYEYIVSQMSWQSNQRYNVYFYTKGFGVNSPVVKFEGAPGSCQVRFGNAQLPAVSSIGALRNANDAAYFRSGSTLHVKFSTKQQHPKRRPDTFRGKTTYQIIC